MKKRFNANAQRYAIDSKPLSKNAEKEIRSRLSAGWEGVAVRDAKSEIYAVLLTPAEFNLLHAAAKIGMNSKPKKRNKKTELTLKEVLKILRT